MSGLSQPARSGCSSTSSPVVGGGNLGSFPYIPGESITNPNCTCGVPTPLRISWTERNPIRRFHKCNRCNFFMWVDPEIKWYNYVLLALLSKKSTMEAKIGDLKWNVEEIERKNRSLQDLLEEYFDKEVEHQTTLAEMQSHVKKLEASKLFYKRVVVILLLLVVLLFVM